MSEELAKELADWQELSLLTWGAFPYDVPADNITSCPDKADKLDSRWADD